MENPADSTVQGDLQADVRTVQTRTVLDEASRQAVIAAVASGQSQTEVAKHFGVHRNTVWSLCNNVKAIANPANPLSPGFKDHLKARAVRAVQAGLDNKRDPYKRATIGVKVLEGIGVFTSKVEQTTDTHIIIEWGTAINVTPLDPTDKT